MDDVIADSATMVACAGAGMAARRSSSSARGAGQDARFTMSKRKHAGQMEPVPA
jgi:hypothetical protein